MRSSRPARTAGSTTRSCAPARRSRPPNSSRARRKVAVCATFALLNPAAGHAEIAALIAAEMERARSEPVARGGAAARRRTRCFAGALAERETASGRAFELGEALVSIGDAQAADRRLQAIAQVTAADVQRVARDMARPQGAVTFTYTQGAASLRHTPTRRRCRASSPCRPQRRAGEAQRRSEPPGAAAARRASPRVARA